jgi:hypothetical protein
MVLKAMKLSELYPYYEKSLLSLVSALEFLSSEELNLVLSPNNQSIHNLVSNILTFHQEWINLILDNSVPLEDTESLSNKNDWLNNLKNIVPLLDKTLASFEQIDLDNFYPVTYWRGSVEVQGKFTLRYILWKIVERTLMCQGEIYAIMRIQGINVPSFL